MSAIIQLPYLPIEFYIGAGRTLELDRCKGLLSYAESKGYSTGILLYTGTSHTKVYDDVLQNPKSLLDKFRGKVGDKLWGNSTLHLPMAPWKPDSRIHFGKEKSVEFHRELLGLAKDAGVKHVVLHSDTVYYVPGSKNSSNSDFVWGVGAKLEASKFSDLAIRLAKDFSDIQFSYENLPVPIKGSVELDPQEILIEPNLVTLYSMNDFLDRTKEYSNISLCLDISHYLIARGTLENLLNNVGLLDNEHVRMLIGSISPNQEDKLIPSKERTLAILKEVQLPTLPEFVTKYGSRINDVQVSDGNGWFPAVSGSEGVKIEEGLPLILGKNHYDEIMETLSILKKVAESRRITFSFDINEEDYVKAPNQEQTLRNVLEKI